MLRFGRAPLINMSILAIEQVWLGGRIGRWARAAQPFASADAAHAQRDRRCGGDPAVGEVKVDCAAARASAAWIMVLPGAIGDADEAALTADVGVGQLGQPPQRSQAAAAASIRR